MSEKEERIEFLKKEILKCLKKLQEEGYIKRNKPLQRYCLKCEKELDALLENQNQKTQPGSHEKKQAKKVIIVFAVVEKMGEICKKLAVA
ncbi:hypothetical protein C0583_01485 [Candidatus Parcubacteria bacterium]|mgnify:CR=1 FL=1|nr:MAG: hypothetical protein C0583_01485 [Candidatus Parcubacteria bacterium]